MSTTTLSSERTAVFEQAAEYALEALAQVVTTDLGRQTPCEHWNVRAVVLHLADVADAVIDLTVTGELVIATPRSAETPEPVIVATQRIHALRDTLTSMSADTEHTDRLLAAAQAGANELAAHGWDIACALGPDRPIPEHTAATLLALIEGSLDDATRGTNFAPASPVPPTASPSDRLVAYLGRRPR